MNRCSIILVVTLLAFVLAGCGGSGTSSVPATEPSNPLPHNFYSEGSSALSAVFGDVEVIRFTDSNDNTIHCAVYDGYKSGGIDCWGGEKVRTNP